jgi:predicted Zn-dependent protease
MSTPQETAERALAVSRADDCIVIADESSNANLRWANNTLTTNGATRSRAVTVIAVIGEAAGVVTRSGVDADGIEDLVRAAEHAARSSTPAEDAQPLVAGSAEAKGWNDPPLETSIEVFGSFAPSLGAAFAAARGHDRLLFGYAEHEMRTTYLASSTGLRLRHDQPTGHVEMNAKSTDFVRSAWDGAATADFTDVDPQAIDARLTDRLAWAARSVNLPAGKYETILPPTAVADLMLDVYWATVARDTAEGRTVFSKAGGGTRVGERLSEQPVTVRSDPGAAGLTCPPFVIARASNATESVFDNGLPLEPTSWIQKGVLNALMQTRHSAQETGLPVTPYIDNLIVEANGGSGGTIEDMVARTDRALLLTCLWYIREVDPQTLLLTGLTRDGVYLVEQGEIVGAVNNFRFNESPVGMLGRITEVGATQRTLPREWTDYFTRAAMPALRVADFNMSSVSEAS